MRLQLEQNGLSLSADDRELLDGIPVHPLIAVAAKLNGEERLPFKLAVWDAPSQALYRRKIAFVAQESFVLQAGLMRHLQDQVVQLGGLYILWPRHSVPPQLEEFFSERAPLVETHDGQFFLVAPNRQEMLESVVRGNVVLDFHDGSLQRPPMVVPPSVTAPRVPAVRDVIETMRGSVYVFEPNGIVRAYGRKGSITVSSPMDWKSAAPYASHKEILRRMGVHVDSDDPVDGIRAALAAVPELLRKHRADTAPDRVLRQSASVLETLRKYDLAREMRERFWEGEASRLLSNAVGAFDGDQTTLPPAMRWSMPDGLAHAQLAPASVANKVLPFVFVRRHDGLGYPFPMFYVYDDLCVHMMGLYARLGARALQLEREGRIAGGALKFVYDSDGVLRDIVLLPSEMWSLSSPGTHLSLTAEEREHFEELFAKRYPTAKISGFTR